MKRAGAQLALSGLSVLSVLMLNLAMYYAKSRVSLLVMVCVLPKTTSLKRLCFLVVWTDKVVHWYKCVSVIT